MSGYTPITRRELYNVWLNEKQEKKKVEDVINYFFVKSGLQNTESEEYCERIEKCLRYLTSLFNEKWLKSNRMKDRFEQRNQRWLDAYFHPLSSQPSTSNFGRPQMQFKNKGEKAKKLEVSPLVNEFSPEKLTFAASVSLYKSGKRDAASIIKNLNESPTKAAKIKKVFNTPTKEPIPYTDEEGLRLFIDGKYTKSTYIAMRIGAKCRNADIYPSYHKILDAKNNYYPRNGIKISDISAEVSLQDLVEHTARRIIELQREKVAQSKYAELTLIYKWGCDGSSGHSTYKQKFNSNNTDKSDEHLFAICMVPLQLKHIEKVIWENPRPSSTRFCRPIKLIFEKESKSLIKNETDCIKAQIGNINPTTIKNGDNTTVINHIFHLTMIDGKVFSTLSDCGAQTCAICGAAPSTMNNLNEIKNFSVKIRLYEYGLSTLHAWIRCLECVLHIAYKLKIQKWQARKKTDKDLHKETKTKVINEIRSEMNLLVDIPKPGTGTTNDGNTARKFFQQSCLASKVTGVNENLIKKLGVILRTMSSGYAINVEAFRAFAFDTAKLYIELYPWYYMPSSVHKILIHGADIIQNAVLPIGMMSEEALESRNKDFRFAREHHTRKMSREKTMEDLFHYLLLSSDPIISSFSTNPTLRHDKEKLFDEEMSLLLDPFVPEMEDETDSH